MSESDTTLNQLGDQEPHIVRHQAKQPTQSRRAHRLETVLEIEAKEDEQEKYPPGGWRLLSRWRRMTPQGVSKMPMQPKNSESEMRTDNAKDESGNSTGSYEAQSQARPGYYTRQSPSN